MRIMLTIIAVLVLSGSTLAATPNTGEDSTYNSTGNVLTYPDSRSCNILYCPADYDDPAFRETLASMTGGTVDYFDASSDTPTLETIMMYDSVLTYPNFAYANNEFMGDLLADYVDAGYNVILSTFCTYTNGYSLAGRIMTSGYSPVSSPDGNNFYTSSSYAGDGVTCLYNAVSGFDHYFRDNLVLQGLGLQDGSYTDGVIAAAYNEIGVLYLNGSPTEANTDWITLVANAACTCEGVIPTEGMSWSRVKSLYR